MSATTPIANGHIILKFVWQDPSMGTGVRSFLDEKVGVVNLQFINTLAEYKVCIPNDASLLSARQLPFRCFQVSGEITSPKSLRVSIEQIRQLTIQAGIVKKTSSEPNIFRWELVELEIPNLLHADQSYALTLTTSTDDLKLFATLVRDDTDLEITRKAWETYAMKSMQVINAMGPAVRSRETAQLRSKAASLSPKLPEKEIQAMFSGNEMTMQELELRALLQLKVDVLSQNTVQSHFTHYQLKKRALEASSHQDLTDDPALLDRVYRLFIDELGKSLLRRGIQPIVP